MSTDETNEPNDPYAAGHDHGGWQPIPQSEGYDSDATAFVQLPPDFDFATAPLEAPGHGYVPPMIVPLTPAAATDPAATGTWVVQEPTEAEYVVPTDPTDPGDFVEHGEHSEYGEHREYGEQSEHAQYGDHSAYGEPAAGAGASEPPAAHDPHATGQWSFPDASQSTGQWTIPTVPEGSDESGEFTTSMLAQYASSAPATLPGGAPAPWAVAEPEPEAAPETDAAVEPVQDVQETASEAPEAPEALPELPEAPEDPGEAGPAPVFDTGSSSDSEEHPHISYALRVNGADRPVTGSWIGESLLYVLRERLGLAGAKDGCSQGECGACNVQVDGRLVASCLVPAATTAGSEIRTVEGLAVDGEPSDVQRALAKCGAVQCGFCVPGMAMTVHDLLEGNHAPTELETRQALCGNLCRCSGYRGVLDAVQEVVAERAATAAADPAAADPADEARIPHQIPHPLDGGMA
ncbi:2Fe-2S iron-sulfur cluster-binding protein [Streptomyces sp. NPDC048629]|uniref:(2Fe-2S)-binding protein n=1 Tax=Streptomyces sp. NPDC048629 TaxID=3154824 RepID=UPI0034248AAD